MSHTEIAAQGGFIRAIEPLRAFAAISVLILHVIYLTNWMDFPKSGPLSWFWIGWLGVDIFFVISGFVVTMAAFREIAQETDVPRLFFLIRRIARIAPLYFLSMAVYLFAINADPVRGDSAWLQISTHLFFAHNFFTATTGAINPPTWTIGTEMQLYLIVMTVMTWLPRFRPLGCAVIVIALAVSYRYLVYSLNIGEPSSHLSHLTTQMPGMIDSFGLGMVLALLKNSRKLVPSSINSAILLIIAVLGLVTCEYILSTYSDIYWKAWWFPAFFRSFAALACFALVAAAITLPRKFESAIPEAAVFLGRISYGIYLWHFIVILLLHKWIPMGKPVFLFSTLVVTIVAATMSWLLIEKPIVAMTQRWLATKTRHLT